MFVIRNSRKSPHFHLEQEFSTWEHFDETLLFVPSHRKARCEMCWPGVKADQRERDENRRENRIKKANTVAKPYKDGYIPIVNSRRRSTRRRGERRDGKHIRKIHIIKASQSGQARSNLARDYYITINCKCHANARLFCDVGEQERGRVRNKGVDRNAQVGQIQVGAGGQGRLLSHISHPTRKQEQASTGRLPTSPSSEIQDPSRERAAGTSHSQDTGTTVADLVWPPGGEGRTPPTTRYSASQQVSIHEVRHRPVFVSSLLRARSLLDPPF
ncbi:hypothetical protein ALC53_00445 [Atta colombica]|uniref:Uncharacterized protein n=1 Tax=Atta colombica TaxID=520822 RepID=A0A195BWE6_9HYME|nr:hypothetical protein ALC53_00445 [Atta colombica]